MPGAEQDPGEGGQSKGGSGRRDICNVLNNKYIFFKNQTHLDMNSSLLLTKCERDLRQVT